MLILGGVVTLLGFFIAGFSLVFLARGQKVPTSEGEPQRIKFRGFELATDRVGLLVFTGTAAMVLPLVSFVYLTRLGDAETDRCRASEAGLKTDLMALKSEIERQKVALDRESVILTARVENAHGEPAERLEGILVREDTTGNQPACARRKLINGEFTCRTPLHDLHAGFLFNALKAGSDDPVRQARIIPMEPTVTVSTDEPQ